MESTNAKMKAARISEKVAGVGIKIAEHGIALRLFSLFIYNFRTRPRPSPYPVPASGEREVRAVSALAFSPAAKEKVPPFGRAQEADEGQRITPHPEVPAPAGLEGRGHGRATRPRPSRGALAPAPG